MDRTFTVEIHDDKVTIGEENSSGVRYYLSQFGGNQLADIAKAVNDYIYTYIGRVGDDV